MLITSLNKTSLSLSPTQLLGEGVVTGTDGTVAAAVARDDAVSVDEVYGGRDVPVRPNVALRLLVVSSKIRNSSALRHALHPNVVCVCYNFDNHSLDDLLGVYSLAELQLGMGWGGDFNCHSCIVNIKQSE